MAWPEDERAVGTASACVILRRLRVTGGDARVAFAVFPRWNFTARPAAVERLSEHAVTFSFKAGALGLWTSFAATATATGAAAEWTVPAGEEHWVVLGWNSPSIRFLPPEHPRCVSTLAVVERELVVDGLLHRFDPRATLGRRELPTAEFESAFLPYVCWHAHLLALLGWVEEARRLLARCDAVAGDVGLLAEQIDPRQNRFLGNTPLLFSHGEYVRAAIATHEASSL